MQLAQLSRSLCSSGAFCSTVANDFDLHGNSCYDRRPPLEVQCPPFGVNSLKSDGTFLTGQEVEDRCFELGFPRCPEGTLLPSGECGSETTQSNPFDCVNGQTIQYRPCYQTGKATIPHFYQVELSEERNGFGLQKYLKNFDIAPALMISLKFVRSPSRHALEALYS